MTDKVLRFSLEVYDGPLDLLLNLVRKNKIDIFDIPIAEITSQYLDELHRMEEADIEISSEFLVMASQLLLMKSRALLPSEEPTEDEMTPEQLAERLEEYRKIKEAAKMLDEIQFSSEALFFKKPEKLQKGPIENVNMEKDLLFEAFKSVLSRVEDRLPPKKENFQGIVGREKVSLPDKIRDVLKFVNTRKKTSFESIFESSKTKGEVVTVFLAVLHLIARGKIKMHERGGKITITKSGDKA
ncbi:MAG: segregation/condensation protein A [Clostridia bacterium]|nr:segregation/condensation protein A [Clostridia bacterium]